MNYQLITEAPAWFIIFCVAAGTLYSFLLYRKEKSFTESSLWLTRLMAIFRFLSVTILCILLLSPLIRTIFREVEKPIVLIMQDESASIVTIKDSTNFLQSYPSAINELKKSLESDFDVRMFSIGDKVTDGINFNFSDKETDLAGPVDEMRARYSGRNLGAVILASDGLYNKGRNPLYAFPELKIPVFTIGLGDTSVRKDVLISRVNHNKTSFFGNTFPVELTVDARHCAGVDLVLSITKNGKEIIKKPIKVTSDRFNVILPVFLEANEKGMNHYIAEVTRVDNEINFQNNKRDFFVEVSDNRQQIILLASSPHPDLAAIRDIIESNPNIQLKTVMIDDFDGNIGNANLVILHQIPSTTKPFSELFEKLKLQNIPVLFILGSQTNVASFNALKVGIKISENRGNVNEVQANPQTDFSLFTMDEENLRRISEFPPLISPFGTYETTGKVYSLLTQKIGTVKTGMPLLVFSVDGEFKTAILAGEGFWKWKLKEFAEHGNSEASTTLLTKTIQYLATREKLTPFRLFYKNTYFENEPLLIDAEFYNESGELVNLADVTISITDENKKSFPFAFSKTEKAYSLNAGYLPVGSYKFTASTTSNNKNYSETGSFTISALQAELSETIANHQLLHALSDRTGGKFFLPNNIAEIAKEIAARNDIKAVSYTQKRLDDVINLKWIFALIILLLAGEWFMRKRSGGY